MSWLPWASAPPVLPDPPKSKYTLSQIQDQYGPIPIALALFTAGGLASVGSAVVYRRYFRRIRNANYILPHHISKQRWIKGVVTSVGDNDNFRLFHTPGFGWSYPLKFRRVPDTRKELANETLHVRIAGVDAPELPHFARRETQPFAEESFAWLKSQIQGKCMYCQLLQKDQYGRVVCFVQHAPRSLPGTFFSGKPLGLEMLRKGWATTYQETGAVYGSVPKEEYLRVEGIARSAKRGMWKNGVGETPAEYKRRYREFENSTTTVTSAKPTATKPLSWLRRSLSRTK